MYRTTEELRRDGPRVRDSMRDAVWFTAGVAVAAVVFMAVAAVWVGTCGESTFDVVACGAPQLTMFRIGAPLILLGGAIVAFHRSYRALRRDGGWRRWSTSGSVLAAAMLIVLAYSV